MKKKENYYKVAEVSDKQFEIFKSHYKYVVTGVENGAECIVGFSNQAVYIEDLVAEHDRLQFTHWDKVSELSRNRDLWLIAISDSELPQLAESFKYTIIGWDDTEEDDGEDIIGFTNSTLISHKVIWDYDYFDIVDNVTGRRFMPDLY